MSQFSEIIELVRKESVTLFIGSGFSLKAGAPSGKTLIDAILKNVPDEDKDDFENSSLESICQRYEDYSPEGRSDLVKTLKPLFDFERKNLEDHEALSGLPHFKRIFTTNYDTLLEDTYGEECYVVKRNNDIKVSDNSRTVIYKIHGDFDNPEEMIITRGDYDKFYYNRNNELIWDIIKAEIATHNILFIGYSLDDRNVTYLIERLASQSGKKPNNLYLIAPGMTKARVNKIKKFGVKYYDAKAEDFLRDLLAAIDRNLVKDVRRGWISDSTFHKCCEKRNLQITLRSNPSEREVCGVKILDHGKHSVNIRVSKEIANTFFSGKRVYNDSILFHGVHIPALKISSENLLDFHHTVNGIWLSDKTDIASVRFAPVHNEIECQILIPSRNFREKVKLIGYNSDKGQATFVMPQDSYELKMVLTVEELSNIKMQFTVDFKDKYTDNTLAIRWLEFLMAIWNNEKVTFANLFGNGRFSIANDEKNLSATDFEQRMEYYKIVNDLEDTLGFSFTTYEMYTSENLELAKILLSYLKKQVIREPSEPGSIISFEMTPTDIPRIEELRVGEGSYPFSVTRETEGVLQFNGKTFSIPYAHELYGECEVVEKKLLSNGNYSLKLKSHSDHVFKFYSDSGSMGEGEGE